MKVIKPGHIYELEHLDGNDSQQLIFVCREEELGLHEGTQTQEVLRAQIELLSILIDRTNHCHECLPWDGNAKIVQEMSQAQRHMRRALLFHEDRARERKVDKAGLKPERIPTGHDGHFRGD